ncbi:hypothetical protein F383_32151 [Gossypium arboreum]|uniref:Uncharacterized protein n=1 Tax=Gossypium arboreum TaxID=29729 RepID=A0A0B0MZ67_GOSAR|nr:hypothetical protein F383_32151 [Gossypium arboreum]
MDRSVSPIMRRNDEYSLRRLSTDSKPHEPFLGNFNNLRLNRFSGSCFLGKNK